MDDDTERLSLIFRHVKDEIGKRIRYYLLKRIILEAGTMVAQDISFYHASERIRVIHDAHKWADSYDKVYWSSHLPIGELVGLYNLGGVDATYLALHSLGLEPQRTVSHSGEPAVRIELPATMRKCKVEEFVTTMKELTRQEGCGNE